MLSQHPWANCIYIYMQFDDAVVLALGVSAQRSTERLRFTCQVLVMPDFNASDANALRVP